MATHPADDVRQRHLNAWRERKQAAFHGTSSYLQESRLKVDKITGNVEVALNETIVNLSSCASSEKELNFLQEIRMDEDRTVTTTLDGEPDEVRANNSLFDISDVNLDEMLVEIEDTLTFSQDQCGSSPLVSFEKDLQMPESIQERVNREVNLRRARSHETNDYVNLMASAPTGSTLVELVLSDDENSSTRTAFYANPKTHFSEETRKNHEYPFISLRDPEHDATKEKASTTSFPLLQQQFIWGIVFVAILVYIVLFRYNFTFGNDSPFPWVRPIPSLKWQQIVAPSPPLPPQQRQPINLTLIQIFFEKLERSNRSPTLDELGLLHFE
jgi:hypothetical protein